MMNKNTYVFIASAMIHLASSVNLVGQVAAPEVPPAPAPVAPAPDPAAPAALAPDSTAPAVVAPAASVPDSAAPAVAVPVAPASSASVSMVPKPVWPDTVEIDVGGKLIEGDALLAKKELFEQAQKMVDIAAEIVTSVDDMRQIAFKEYLKTKKSITTFALDTEIKLGKIKESLLTN